MNNIRLKMNGKDSLSVSELNQNLKKHWSLDFEELCGVKIKKDSFDQPNVQIPYILAKVLMFVNLGLVAIYFVMWIWPCKGNNKRSGGETGKDRNDHEYEELSEVK